VFFFLFNNDGQYILVIHMLEFLRLTFSHISSFPLFAWFCSPISANMAENSNRFLCCFSHLPFTDFPDSPSQKGGSAVKNQQAVPVSMTRLSQKVSYSLRVTASCCKGIFFFFNKTVSTCLTWVYSNTIFEMVIGVPLAKKNCRRHFWVLKLLFFRLADVRRRKTD